MEVAVLTDVRMPGNSRRVTLQIRVSDRLSAQEIRMAVVLALQQLLADKTAEKPPRQFWEI